MTEATKPIRPDGDEHMGAVENDPRDAGDRPKTSMAGQLPHRDQDPLIKDNDTDFPEPDAEEEHTGEPRG